MLNRPYRAVFSATFTETLNFNASFAESLGLSAQFGEVIISHDVDWYDGPYEFTPTQETQTVEIAQKAAYQNITINPIPWNYGLITWDGSALTVS